MDASQLAVQVAAAMEVLGIVVAAAPLVALAALAALVALVSLVRGLLACLFIL
jgi:hypothetical protein